MKVLLLVPQAAATVGEEWVSYKLADAITRVCDTTVVAMRRSGEKMSIAELLPAATEVHECEAWATQKFGERINAIAKPSYLKFHRFANATIAGLLARGRFDVAHQIGPVGMRYPSPLRRFDVPYIIGPVGGTQPTPPALRDDDESFPLLYRLRALDRPRLRFDPYLRATYERAAAVVGIAPYVADMLAGLRLRRLEYQSESAIDALPEVTRRPPEPGKLKLLHVGRAIRTKGLLYIVQAMARVKDVPGLHLDAVGGGPDLENCIRLAHELGVDDRITFHGQRKHAELAAFFAAGDLLIHPTFRDAGGVALFEAMGYGLPVVCSNYGAPGHFVNDSFGIRVSVASREDLVAGLAGAIRQLAGSPERLVPMSQAARSEIANKHLWSSRAAFFRDLFESVAASARVAEVA
jgi:glycosyltransferase involved in cell wall biosynthesis